MTYHEFKTTYQWMLKHYPNMDRYYRDDMYAPIGTMEIIRYEKQGRRWVEIGRETDTLTAAKYCNSVDAGWFFKRCSYYERIDQTYTRYGYLPIRITSISPDRQVRIIRTFDPED